MLSHAAAEIFLDPFLGRGRRAGEHVGRIAIRTPYLDPLALRSQPFAGLTEVMSDDCD